MTRELTVLRHALSQGHVTPAQVRETLLLRESLRQDGVAAPPLRLVARLLAGDRRADLERVWLRLRREGDPPDDPAALAPWPDPLPPAATQRARQWSLRPLAEDPPAVKTALDALRAVRAPDELTRDDGATPRPSSGRILPAPSLVPSASSTAETRIGPCRIVRELGRGGCGAVLLAHHERLDRQVAVKVLHGQDARSLTRFRTEGRVMARVRHPHVVGVHDVGDQDGAPYLVMDYIEGESLAERIRREDKLDVRDAVRIAAAVARGLDAAHRQSVLHRDVKPHNILLDRAGEPLLTDFGIARAIDESRALTNTGQMLGTIAYAAPEQVSGHHGAVDARCDVYALGATLYEMLTGRPPFEGGMPVNVLYAVTSTPPQPPRELRPELSRTLERIVLRCLEKRPDARFPSAAALAEALEAWLARGTGPAQSTAGTVPMAAAAGLLVLGLAVGAGAALLVRPSPRAAVVAPPPTSTELPRDDAPFVAVAPVGSITELVADARARFESDPRAAAEVLAHAYDLDPIAVAATAADLAPSLAEAAERALHPRASVGDATRARRWLVRARELAPDIDLSAAVAAIDSLTTSGQADVAEAACPWLGAPLPGEADWARKVLKQPFSPTELDRPHIQDRVRWDARLRRLWNACETYPRPGEAFEAALLRRPEAAALWWGRARVASDRGEFGRAARLLDVAIVRSDEGFLRHQRARLELLRPGGTLDGAIELARATRRTDVRRGEAEAWPWHAFLLARLLAERGTRADLEEALVFLQALVEARDFEHPTAFAVLSRVHQALGDHEEQARRATERQDKVDKYTYGALGDRE